MKRKIWTRSDILASSGIKEVEWPVGWYLHGEPEFCVSPKAPQQRGRKR